MNRHYIRNLCIAAVVSMIMVTVISVGFAYIGGNFNVMNMAMDDKGTSNPTSVHEREHVPEMEPNTEEPQPEPIFQRIDLKAAEATEAEYKVPETKTGAVEPEYVSADRPDYGRSTSDGMTHISHDLALNGKIRLSLVDFHDTDSVYSHINQICPRTTSIAYQVDSGLGTSTKGDGSKIEYAKVWCLHDSPDPDAPFSEWQFPGGYMSLNEWVIRNGHAVIDKSSCNRSDFGGQQWAVTLGC